MQILNGSFFVTNLSKKKIYSGLEDSAKKNINKEGFELFIELKKKNSNKYVYLLNYNYKEGFELKGIVHFEQENVGSLTLIFSNLSTICVC